MRDQHLLLVAAAEQRDQRGDAQLVGKDDLQTEAIEGEKRTLVEDAGVVRQIGPVVRVTDADAVRLHAFGEENLQLLVAERAVIGVRDDRYAGRLLCPRGGAQQAFLVWLDRALASGALDEAGLDAGCTDAVLDLLLVELGDFGDEIDAEAGTEAEMRAAEVLLVVTRRADHVHAGLLRALRHELRIASEIVGAGVDERLDAEALQLLQHVTADLHRFLAVEGKRGVAFPSRPTDQEMLVDEGLAELGYFLR